MGLLLLAAVASLFQPSGWDRSAYDLSLTTLRGLRPEVSRRIAYLSIGMEDLKNKASTRAEYDGVARMVSLARHNGAAVVVLDLMFLRGEKADFQALWGELHDDDVVLADTCEEHTPRPPDSSASLGLVDMDVERDGTIRRYRLAPPGPGGQPAPSLALAAYLKMQGLQWSDQTVRDGLLVMADSDDTGSPLKRQIPETFLFDQRANFSDETRANFEHCTPARLESLDPERKELLGKVVFIAYVAPGSGDLGATPLDHSTPRVAVHAWALNDLIQDTWRQDAPLSWRGGLTMFLLGLGWLLSARLGGAPLLAAWLGGTVTILAGVAWAMVKTHRVFPGVSLVLAWTVAVGLESYRRRKLLDLRQVAVRAGNDPLVGRTVGARVLVDKLGQGGFATVYRALDQATLDPESAVAVKIIHPGQAENPNFQRRFLREVRICAELKHPAIVRLLDSGEQDGLLYLTMELLQGRALSYYREARPGPWSLEEALPVIQPLMEGMAYAHAQGVLHRDLKPDNLMVEMAGSGPPWRPVNVKIVDFGLAFDNQSSQITRSSEVFGTLDYLAPERIQGSPDDARSDQYAVGVMAYEMLAGCSPFPQGSTGESLLHRLTKDTPPLSEFRPDLPLRVLQTVDRMMSREIESRFASLQEALTSMREEGLSL